MVRPHELVWRLPDKYSIRSRFASQGLGGDYMRDFSRVVNFKTLEVPRPTSGL